MAATRLKVMATAAMGGTDFVSLDADAKSRYIVEATKAITAIAEDIKAHVKRRDDEIEGGRVK